MPVVYQIHLPSGEETRITPNNLVNESHELILWYESVADGRFRDDEFRFGGVILNLFAQVSDVNAQVMCLLDGFRSSNFSQKLAMR